MDEPARNSGARKSAPIKLVSNSSISHGARSQGSESRPSPSHGIISEPHENERSTKSGSMTLVEQAESTSRRRKSISLHTDAESLLWYGLLRRAKCISTSRHEAVLRKAIRFLQATIATGYGSGKCGRLADVTQKAHLSELMSEEVLRKMADRLDTTKGRRDFDVKGCPTAEEARKASAHAKSIVITAKPLVAIRLHRRCSQLYDRRHPRFG